MSVSIPEAEPRWRPLLRDELAESATAAVLDVAAELSRRRGSEGPGEASLGAGAAGISIFYDYVARAGLIDAAAGEAAAWLDAAVDAAAGGASGPSLYSGFGGVAWASAFVDAGDGAADDAIAEVDDVLAAFTARSPWPYDYDLVRGLVGHGVYALERISRPAASRLLEHVIARLDELAERRRDGITWFTRPELLPPETRAEFPRGYYDVGVAHGVPGVVALLARCIAADVAADCALELLDGAVEWLLRRRLPAGAPASFPAIVTPGRPRDAARAAWCYGDPGVACTLLLAARATGREAWERAAIDIASSAARRSPGDAGVRDACLCHGASGLAHLLNRLHQATGAPDLRDAAVHWYRAALEMRRPGRGVAGFTTWSETGPGETGMVADPGFLQGAAGIGLALTAAVSPAEPAWDRVLLLS
ncbi:MAG: lanthionine synthetase C family protein [Actinomycetota bacterium]|nr:lanthionine synthetase C family protein [Actinomycetota bacterium]